MNPNCIYYTELKPIASMIFRGFKTNGSLFVVEFENMLIILKGGGVFVKFLVMPLHCKILRKYVI